MESVSYEKGVEQILRQLVECCSKLRHSGISREECRSYVQKHLLHLYATDPNFDVRKSH